VCDRRCVQQGCLIPLPQVVVVPYTLSILLGYPDTESGGVIDDDVLLSRSALLDYTLLSITNWFRRFSARRPERCAGVACSEFYKTLRSASCTGGQDRRYHSSHGELPPRPCARSFATLGIVLPVLRTGIRQNTPGQINVARFVSLYSHTITMSHRSQQERGCVDLVREHADVLVVISSYLYSFKTMLIYDIVA
jgi:hypothetical protein